MQFVPFDDLNCCSNRVFDAVCERVAGVAAVNQNVSDLTQMVTPLRDHCNCSRPVSHVRRRHMNRMRQTIRIHGNMALDAGYFLAGVVAFFCCCVSVLDTLGINNQKSGVRAATITLSDLAN